MRYIKVLAALLLFYSGSSQASYWNPFNLFTSVPRLFTGAQPEPTPKGSVSTVEDQSHNDNFPTATSNPLAVIAPLEGISDPVAVVENSKDASLSKDIQSLPKSDVDGDGNFKSVQQNSLLISLDWDNLSDGMEPIFDSDDETKDLDGQDKPKGSLAQTTETVLAPISSSDQVSINISQFTSHSQPVEIGKIKRQETSESGSDRYLYTTENSQVTSCGMSHGRYGAYIKKEDRLVFEDNPNNIEPKLMERSLHSIPDYSFAATGLRTVEAFFSYFDIPASNFLHALMSHFSDLMEAGQDVIPYEGLEENKEYVHVPYSQEIISFAIRNDRFGAWILDIATMNLEFEDNPNNIHPDLVSKFLENAAQNEFDKLSAKKVLPFMGYFYWKPERKVQFSRLQ